MIKKLAVVVLAVGAGAFLLHSTHLGAFARTAWDKTRAAAEKQIPLEFQLDSIRGEVSQLVPDMRRHISQVAAETVAVQSLREDIRLRQEEPGPPKGPGPGSVGQG